MDIFFDDHLCCKRHIAPEFYSEPLTQSRAVKLLGDLFLRWRLLMDQTDSRYWLGGGSLLGAFRSQSIIPWDDDIDVGMTHNDFALLIDSLQETGPDKRSGHWVEIYETESEVLRISPSWQNVVLENDPAYWVDAKFVDKKYGLWIDVLVYHVLDADRLIRKFPIRGKLGIFPRSMFFPLNAIQFEGSNVPTPKELRPYLRVLYGDDLDSPDHEFINGRWLNISPGPQ